MKNYDSTRRSFLGAGLALPVVGSASVRTDASLAGAPATLAETQPKFEYRTLGKTGMKVTRVAYGCMVTSDQSVIERAADIGINFFDTARVYSRGNNERMVGAALKGKRNKVYISTKTQARNKAAALEDIDTSLRELQTDHVDIWYLHSRSTPDSVTDDVMEAQEAAVKAGKVRFKGISFHSGHAEMIPFALKKNFFDVILLSYNFAMGNTIDKLLEDIHKANVGIVGMKVMAGGLRRTSFYPISDETHKKLQEEGAMVAALKWVLKNPSVDTIIPSIVDMDQLDEDVRAMGSPFSQKEARILSAHLDYMKPVYCRFCGDCTGACPKGLPVSDMLRYLMYAEGYGQFDLGREHFQQLPADIASVRCSDCSACAVQCPNGVKVASRLSRAQEIFA